MGLRSLLGLDAPERASAPTTPPSGRRLLYPKSDGWYEKTSAGVETKVGPSAGGGGSSSADYGLDTDYTTTTPTSPTAGVKLFARHRARRLPATVGPQGLDTVLQPALFSNRISWMSQYAGNSVGSTWNLSGAVHGAAAAAATLTPATSFFTGLNRARWSPTAATAGLWGGYRTQAAWFRSGTANLGGFFFVARFGLSVTTSSNRVFVGLCPTLASFGNVQPSTFVNSVGFYSDSTQSTFQVGSNDASGTMTGVDLGANFSSTVAATNFYEARLFVPSGNTTDVFYSMTRLNDGTTANGVLTTNLPVANTLMAAHIAHGTTTAALVTIDIQSLYVETDN